MKLYLTLATSLVVAVALSTPVMAKGKGKGADFRAAASGEQERVSDAEVDTKGGADGRFQFSRDLSSMRATVRASKLKGNVTGAHLHCAVAGQNGPVIVNLDAKTGSKNGTIVKGNFKNADIATDPPKALCESECGFEVNNIASLVAAGANGCLYVNVHTDFSAAGEVRGQLFPQ